jgi:hypothetical protein
LNTSEQWKTIRTTINAATIAKTGPSRREQVCLASQWSAHGMIERLSFLGCFRAKGTVLEGLS